MVMGTLIIGFKRTVAAFVVGVGLSGPIGAQQTSLDGLFQELLVADPESHAAVADQITDHWLRSGSPAMDLLYRRGEQALEEGAPEIAVEHFTALVDHAPDFAEGYHARASAYFALELIGPALDDLRQVLRMEPRHFEALFGFGAILERMERPEAALEVYEAVLEIYPLDPEATNGIERLKLQLEGQSL